MKVFKIILICLLLTACSYQKPVFNEAMLRNQIVQIESIAPMGSEGKGVILSRHQILTSRHVVERCAQGGTKSQSGSNSFPCRVVVNGQKYPIQKIHFPDPVRDTALLEVDLGNDYAPLSEISERELTVGGSVLILTETGRVQGRILGLAEDYLGYDATLSGKLLSGTIVTDIFVDHGESGTAIWTLSGELIGVMSAVDTLGKRSYGVR